MGKHFIDPKRNEIFSNFSVQRRKLPFLAETVPCPFEILAETLICLILSHTQITPVHYRK
jgi:hypothetical protein